MRTFVVARFTSIHEARVYDPGNCQIHRVGYVLETYTKESGYNWVSFECQAFDETVGGLMQSGTHRVKDVEVKRGDSYKSQKFPEGDITLSNEGMAFKVKDAVVWETLVSSEGYQRVTIFARSDGHRPTKVFMVGDSHAFDYKHTSVDHKYFIAASAKGLANPTSVTGTHDKVIETLLRMDVTHAVFKFGQVDMDFMFYAQHQDSKKYVDSVVKRYFTFLRFMSLFTNVCVVSINPPTYADGPFGERYTRQQLLGVPMVRRLESLYNRSKMSKMFNTVCSQTANKCGIRFINTHKFLVGSNDMVDRKFLSHNFEKHHMWPDVCGVPGEFSREFIDVTKRTFEPMIRNFVHETPVI